MRLTIPWLEKAFLINGLLCGMEWKRDTGVLEVYTPGTVLQQQATYHPCDLQCLDSPSEPGFLSWM